MKYQFQTRNTDCFPTCFRNAMHHFGVSVNAGLSQRLEVFLNGTECCSFHAAHEDLKEYDSSQQKFRDEWNSAEGLSHYNGPFPWPTEKWANYLLKQGIYLDFRVGPIEGKYLMLKSLQEDKIIICDIMIPNGVGSGFSKHAVLIVKYETDKLLIHDPLEKNREFPFESDSLRHFDHECGSNLVIDIDYFFSITDNLFKPRSNPESSELGYSFLIIGKHNSSDHHETKILH